MNLVYLHWYRFNDRGEIHIGQYIGRQKGFECMVCRKGTNAYTFNIWCWDKTGGHHPDYETWSYGKEHLPEIIEDLGESSYEIIDKVI